MKNLDKHEKWLHFGAAFLSAAMAFAADAMGFELSEQTTWLLYAFAGGASVLGGVKAVTGRAPKPADADKE